ncbi:MAG: CsgG/HfaB family protein, partial [Spirochaetota bacterium]
MRVAVLDFTSSNLPEVYASTIRDQIEVSLYKTKNIDLLERNRIALAMKEKNIKEFDSRDAETLSRLGRILSATYVITANITCLETCSITIRVIEVSSGRIVYADSQTMPRKDSVDAAVKELSSRLTSFFLTVTPETKMAQSSHPLSLPFSIGYVQPIGDLSHIAKGGISLSTG